MQLPDLFYSDQGANTANAERVGRSGLGSHPLQTTFDFKQGEIRQTGNDLDAALDGNGLFVLKSKTVRPEIHARREFGSTRTGSW